MTYSPGWTYKSASVTTAQAFEDFRRYKVDLNPNKVKKSSAKSCLPARAANSSKERRSGFSSHNR